MLFVFELICPHIQNKGKDKKSVVGNVQASGSQLESVHSLAVVCLSVGPALSLAPGRDLLPHTGFNEAFSPAVLREDNGCSHKLCLFFKNTKTLNGKCCCVLICNITNNTSSHALTGECCAGSRVTQPISAGLRVLDSQLSKH